MVSYYNPLAMYRHQQQSAQYSPGTAGWYPPQPTQQYLPPCMGEVEPPPPPPHSVPSPWSSADTHKYLTHHPAFTPDWPQDCNHFQVGEAYFRLIPGSRSGVKLIKDSEAPESSPQSVFQQPSPPISEVSSPGVEGLTPTTNGPTTMAPQRPQPSRSPYEWMKKASYHPNPGKTRTKDKYRVVYSDHQRLELEKEFHYSRYITIRRKAELATSLGLSERQIKIWFQNRRAKERKQVKKREESQLKIKQEVLDPLSAVVAATATAAAAGMTLHHSPLHQMTGSGGAATAVTMHGGVPLM